MRSSPPLNLDPALVSGFVRLVLSKVSDLRFAGARPCFEAYWLLTTVGINQLIFSIQHITFNQPHLHSPFGFNQSPPTAPKH